MPDKKKYHKPQQVSFQTKERIDRIVQQMISIPPSHTDPNGSYTGKPVNAQEVPVQDADDL